jgi:hypothetical protein
MAINIAWETGLISVPKVDTILIGTDPITGREIRTFDTEQFHKDLRSSLESQAGRPFPNTHLYAAETIIDGINYAAKITMNLNYYRIEFENGSYRVVLINTNNNIAGGTVINNVSIQPSNAAGLVGSDDIRSQSFIDATVYLNISTGYFGTGYPIGTPKKRSNNILDSITIANNEGLKIINLTGFLSILNSTSLDSFKIEGGSGSNNVIILNGGGTYTSEFSKLIVVGEFNGLSRIRNCILGDSGLGGVTGIEGRIVDCIINHPDGIVQKIGGDGTLFDNCAFISPNYPQITLDANGEGIGLRNCTGNILLKNYTKNEINQLHIIGGTLEIDASCTGGTIVVDGTGEVIDNSGGTVIINNLNQGGTGTTVWTEVEKNQIIADTDDAKRQATIAAMNTQQVAPL